MYIFSKLIFSKRSRDKSKYFRRYVVYTILNIFVKYGDNPFHDI